MYRSWTASLPLTCLKATSSQMPYCYVCPSPIGTPRWMAFPEGARQMTILNRIGESDLLALLLSYDDFVAQFSLTSIWVLLLSMTPEIYLIIAPGRPKQRHLYDWLLYTESNAFAMSRSHQITWLILLLLPEEPVKKYRILMASIAPDESALRCELRTLLTEC